MTFHSRTAFSINKLKLIFIVFFNFENYIYWCYLGSLQMRVYLENSSRVTNRNWTCLIDIPENPTSRGNVLIGEGLVRRENERWMIDYIIPLLNRYLLYYWLFLICMFVFHKPSGLRPVILKWYLLNSPIHCEHGFITKLQLFRETMDFTIGWNLF